MRFSSKSLSVNNPSTAQVKGEVTQLEKGSISWEIFASGTIITLCIRGLRIQATFRQRPPLSSHSLDFQTQPAFLIHPTKSQFSPYFSAPSLLRTTLSCCDREANVCFSLVGVCVGMCVCVCLSLNWINYHEKRICLRMKWKVLSKQVFSWVRPCRRRRRELMESFWAKAQIPARLLFLACRNLRCALVWETLQSSNVINLNM